MHLSTRNALFLLLFLLFFPWGCRTAETTISGTPVMAKTFTQGYDEVWEALEEVLVEELMLPIKIKDREKGLIETEWISVIRIRGTLRWYLKIHIDKGENQTVVRIYDRVEEPINAKDNVGTLKTKKGEIKTGWQTSQEKIPETDTILNRLSSRLGE